MTVPPDRTSYVRRWIEKAEHDLLNAEHTLQMNPDVCPYDTVCFHAQQLAEKYIKAFLVHLNIDFYKTHDLQKLFTLVPSLQNNPFPLSIIELETLSEHAVTGRYPGLPDEIGSAEAHEAISIARRVRDWVREQLPKELFQSL